MQAVKTRYLGPTNHKGSRIKATAYAGSVTISFDYALDLGANHEAAAVALLTKLSWDNGVDLRGGVPRLVSGTLPCGDFCHIWT